MVGCAALGIPYTTAGLDTVIGEACMLRYQGAATGMLVTPGVEPNMSDQAWNHSLLFQRNTKDNGDKHECTANFRDIPVADMPK